MRDKRNQKFWQRTAFVYTGFMRGNSAVFDKIGGYACAYLQPEFRVLELACGTGQMTYRLCDRVSEWVATDFSTNMLDQARKNGYSPKLRFQQADATNLPFADAQFDAVVISNALHIMLKPDKALREIRRVLKAGGLLIAPTFVFESGYSRIRFALMRLAGFRTYQKWTADAYADYVEKRGYILLKKILIPASPAAECVLVGVSDKKEGDVIR